MRHAVSTVERSMRRGTLLAAAVMAMAACVPRTTVRQTVSQTVEVREAPASMVPPSAFVAAVPAFGEGGRCERYALDGGIHLVVLRFDGPGGTQRNVALRYSATGVLLGYSDVRGDVRSPPAGPHTAITIGFDTHQASAVNEHAAEGTQGILFARDDEVMDLPNLGTPRQMMETVKAKCGT
jgi:hypothetical protein